MTNEEYKKLSIKEFTKAAGIYEGDKAGIYEMCKKDYPDIMAELEREPFVDLLDAGCGPAPMISLLSEKYPEQHYTGLLHLSWVIARTFHLKIIPLIALFARTVFTIIQIHRRFLTVCKDVFVRVAD